MFYPILVIYFFVLAFVTMKERIRHMLKYKYVPFSFGKKRYGGKGSVASPAAGVGNVVNASPVSAAFINPKPAD